MHGRNEFFVVVLIAVCIEAIVIVFVQLMPLLDPNPGQYPEVNMISAKLRSGRGQLGRTDK